MKKKVERRSCRRFHVPDATVCYRMKRVVSFPAAYSEESLYVNNLSLGGINFYSPRELPEGKSIQVLLSAPGMQGTYELTGRVAWVTPTGRQQFQVGVEFDPYAPGGRRGCNKIEALKSLIALEEKCSF